MLLDKREITYHSDKLSQLFVLQNILGCDRIESSRPLNQGTILKDKLEIDNYPDPETFLRGNRSQSVLRRHSLWIQDE